MYIFGDRQAECFSAICGTITFLKNVHCHYTKNKDLVSSLKIIIFLVSVSSLYLDNQRPLPLLPS